MLNHSYWNSKEPNGIEPAEKPHEECGVFGFCMENDVMPPAYAAYNGLLALQHRGQESCGIAVNDRGVVSYHKDMGLVSEVFSSQGFGQAFRADVRQPCAVFYRW